MGAVAQIIGTPFTPYYRPPIQRAVFVKRQWTDDWTWIPYLDCSWAEDVLPPSSSRAEMVWRFGRIKREDQTALATYTPLIVNDNFVAVYAYNYYGYAKVWCGIIEDETVGLWGSGGAMSGYSSGKQVFSAFGLDHLLDRAYIWQSYTEDGLIDRPMIYNGRQGRGVRALGNRTSSTDGDGLYGFGAAGDTWTNKDILDVVLAKWAPGGITWKLSGDTTALSSMEEVHDLYGLTVKEALNRLIPMHRGLGWKIWTTGSGTVWIYVFSTISESVAVGQYYIGANPYQAVLSVDGVLDLDVSMSFNELTRFDEFRIQGAPLKVTGTFAVADGSLEAGWSSAEQTTYKTGSTKVSPTSKDHDKARKIESLRSVFQKLNVPNNFNFQLGDGEGGSGDNGVPYVNWDGTVDMNTTATIHQEEKVFLRDLCLEEENNAGYGQPQFRRAFALIADEDGDFQYVDRLLDTDGNAEEMRVTPSDTELAFFIEPKINHILASAADWSGASASEVSRKYDWRDIIITAQYETDDYLAVEMSRQSVPSGTPRQMFISVPDAEAWLVLDQTVLDVDTDGTLIRQSGASMERSDYQRLQFICLLAVAWYGQFRGTVHIVKKGFTMTNPTGTMVHSVQGVWHSTPVGTIITRRRWDFEDQQPTSTLQTGFTELALHDFGVGV